MSEFVDTYIIIESINYHTCILIINTSYIYIFNPWKIFCNPGFHEVFCKTTIIRQLRRWNELKIENMTKYREKTVRICLFFLGGSVFCRIFDFQFIPSS